MLIDWLVQLNLYRPSDAAYMQPSGLCVALAYR
jgi:hypothetical protein